jgi:hypothetical protein
MMARCLGVNASMFMSRHWSSAAQFQCHDPVEEKYLQNKTALIAPAEAQLLRRDAFFRFESSRFLPFLNPHQPGCHEGGKVLAISSAPVAFSEMRWL